MKTTRRARWLLIVPLAIAGLVACTPGAGSTSAPGASAAPAAASGAPAAAPSASGGKAGY